MNLLIGGGDIATRGIIPIVGGTVPENCDVTSYPSVLKTIRAAMPEVVINCAGVSHVSTVAESDPILWAQEQSVNLLGSYHVAKASIACGVDTMIFIASVSGKYGKPNHAGYCASKAGVISLVQSLGMEGHNAFAISPGRVDTKLREKDYPGEDPRTRLDPLQVGVLVKDILEGKYKPGENIVLRKIGYDTFTRVDRGAPWRSYLRVGEPVLY